MKTRILLSLSVAFVWKIELYAYPSLLLTQEEISSIQESQTCFKDSKRLFLQAIVYFDKDHWCLWINHKIIRPENRDELEDFHIESVEPFEVTFSWFPIDSKEQERFTLRPGQTFFSK